MVQTAQDAAHKELTFKRWKKLPDLTPEEIAKQAQAAPVQWSFTLHKSACWNFGIAPQKWSAKFGGMLEIPVPEFDRLSISDFHDNGYAWKLMDLDQISFYKTRFQLFADKINKYRRQLDPEAPQLSDILSTIAHYFRIKNKLYNLEEQKGEAEALEMFAVPKNQLLEETAKFATGLPNRLPFEDIMDMIDRHIFVKTPWFGDIQHQMDVVLSERMIAQLDENRAKYQVEHILIYMHYLSTGQSLIGTTASYMAPEVNSVDTHRIQAHFKYLLTWLSFERLRPGVVIGSAFVPRRVPKFRTRKVDGEHRKEFAGFKLSHYAMLLGTCREEPQVDNTEFYKDLPESRLKPFARENYLAALESNFKSDDYFIDEVLGVGRAFTDYNQTFTNDFMFQLEHKQLKKSRVTMYKLASRFTFKFNLASRDIGFLCEQICYAKNPQTGFWEFDPKLATEESFRTYVNESMPQWFVAGVRQYFTQERLFLQRVSKSTMNSMGYALKQETLQRMEKQNIKVAQVLEMMPTLKTALNVDQMKIMSAKNNLFILGRSGTGKTTTTVLRFFCQETLYCAFRKQQRLLNKYWLDGDFHMYWAQQKSLPKLASEDVSEATGVYMVFVTASPVLTNEVKQYYQSLKHQLISHLTQIEKVGAVQKASECETDQEKAKLLSLIELKEKELLQAETLDQQLTLPHSYSDLTSKQFPLFLTVQRLVYMLDGALRKSFFSRTYDKKIIGMESSLGWHSEDQGVFMINQDFKQSEDVKRELEEFELQVLTGEAAATQVASDGNKQSNEDFSMDMMAGVGSIEKMQVEKDHDQDDQAPHTVGKLDRTYRSNKYNQISAIRGRKRKRLMAEIDNFPLCQEVTFEVFEQRFIGRYYRFMSKKLAMKLSPSFIWTEFMSVIKGSINQNSQVVSFLSMGEYLCQGSSMISRKEKQTLYYLFLKYEEWKLNVRAFDFLDVVNHVIREQIVSGYSESKKIDYLIIDEVQDLYPKTVKLLLSQTRYKVIFAGDTAQTIAKGVSVRISDMSKTLSHKMKLNTDQINLSINYRSQNSILSLANCVVKLIETIFPDSIDKMTEEVSQRTGPKPIILASMGDKLLCQYFFGKTQEEAKVDDDFDIIDDEEDDKSGTTKASSQPTSSVPHFGASQVVIVREQRVKDQLPSFMKSMLCLTVYEAKGLEFDDVILFNFFAMGEIRSQQWKLLQGISEKKSIRGHIPDWVLEIDDAELNEYVESAVDEALKAQREEREKAKAEKGVDKKDDSRDKEEILAEEEKEEQTKMEKVRKEKTREFRRLKREAAIKKFEADGENAEFLEEYLYSLDNSELEYGDLQRKFSQLCTELKFLYVAITRPKNRLFIYDENIQDRKPIEDIWDRIGAVQWVTKEEVQHQLDQQTAVISETQASQPQTMISTSGEKATGTLSTTGCDMETWKFQGLRFLKQKNYEQAIKCFKYAGEKNLMMRCKAYIAAKDAQEMQSQTDSDTWEFKRRKSCFSRRYRRSKLDQLKSQRIETCRRFYQAGVAFEKAEMIKLAASCFFTARSYSKAAELFNQLEMWSQAGESIACLGKNRLKEAASYFEKGGLILRAIECYEQVQEWEPLLHCLNRNQEKFGETERQSLVNKYVPIALNNIYKQHGIVIAEDKDGKGAGEETVPVGDKGNIGQQVQERIEQKYKVKNAIQEEEALDEYGEELVFAEDDDSSDEESKSAGDENAEKIEPEDALDNSDDENAEDGVLSKEFRMESLIKDQYRSKMVSQDAEGQGDDDDEEAKGEPSEKEESFEVIDSEEDGRSQGNNSTGGGDDQTDAKAKLRESLMSDGFDHLSQYDPDDQLISSDRSISIIESFMSKDAKGNSLKPMSETSEFSIISSPNIKSIVSSLNGTNDQVKGKISQISFIDRGDDDDNYMQDILAQKIIYYLSLWSDDMRKQLATLKQRGVLHEAEKDAHGESIDETDFIIQMDDVDQEFVNLILDTLEIYEFYHMSLMMCKRYHLSGRQGRYLVLMCSKYSNLNAFRVDFLEKLHNKKFQREQKVCSLLAHEAIHNVLGLIDSEYLRMKPFGEELTDQNSLGIQAYQNMLNLGYWKKLVYIMEKRQSLHLCLKFFDFQNFQVILRAFMTQEEKIANRHLLNNWTIKAQLKAFLLMKQTIFKQLIRRKQYPELAAELDGSSKDIVSAVQLNQKTMQGMVDIQMRISDLITFVGAETLTSDERKAKTAQIRGELDGIVCEAMQAFGHGAAGSNLSTEPAKFAGAAMVFDIILNFNTAKFAQRIQKQLLGSLSCLTSIYNIMFDAFSKLDKLEAAVNDPVLNALFSVLLISSLEEENSSDEKAMPRQNILGSYADAFMLVNINSPIYEDICLLQSHQNQSELHRVGEEKYQKLKWKYYLAQTVRFEIKKTIECAKFDRSVLQWKPEGQGNSSFVADMDAQFLYVPKSQVIGIIRARLTKAMVGLIYLGREKSLVLDIPGMQRCKKFLQALVTASKNHIKQFLGDYMGHSRTISSFWNDIQITPNFIPKFDKIMLSLSLDTFVRLLKKAKKEKIAEDESGIIQVESLIKSNNREIDVSTDRQDIQKAFEQFLHVFGNGMKLTGRKTKDAESVMKSLFYSVQRFVKIDHYLPMLELYRLVMKKAKGIPGAQDSDMVIILKEAMRLIDCHIFIKNGQWSLATSQILALGNVGTGPLAKMTSLTDMINCLEFAAYTTMMQKFGTSCLPDYALHYLEGDTNFKVYYEDEQLGDLVRRQSSGREAAKPQVNKSHKVGQSKGGFGRKEQGMVYDYDCEDEAEIDYYEETGDHNMAAVQNEEDEGTGEDYYRPIFDKKIGEDTPIEKPEKAAEQRHYEAILAKLVYFVDLINAEELAFGYKPELQRVYNILMAVVVNDSAMSKKVATLVGQCFNRLVSGPYDDYFIELGVPEEWYSSKSGNLLSASDFKDQQAEFEASEDGLKWQWFTPVDADRFFTIATGFYVAKIDLTSAQTEQNQAVIAEKERRSIIFENRQLALRMAAARQISCAFRRILDKTNSSSRKSRFGAVRTGVKDDSSSVPDRKALGSYSEQELRQIAAHAMAYQITPLLNIHQVDSTAFVKRLMQIQKKRSYLQELMVAKVFRNSIEISKAVDFMAKLNELHTAFCKRAVLFARDQAEIHDQYDMLDSDALTPLRNDLAMEAHKLEIQIDSWLTLVFQGDSSGLALKTILETQNQVQKRLKLKWQQIKPQTSSQRLNFFRRMKQRTQ